ncbi:hypothetical protein C8A03DRAFT_37207 [Achaetomium macrosporum]|uniref:Uncharacterized protein n=1 Tax=Achaetomium macrosporum TaxID=79813 RepID=A0AAN7C5U4_9PEZI|nr:hypothetical protein C8A03DRAFT_37207 [Achaetomium macrosporum]
MAHNIHNTLMGTAKRIRIETFAGEARDCLCTTAEAEVDMYGIPHVPWGIFGKKRVVDPKTKKSTYVGHSGKVLSNSKVLERHGHRSTTCSSKMDDQQLTQHGRFALTDTRPHSALKPVVQSEVFCRFCGIIHLTAEYLDTHFEAYDGTQIEAWAAIFSSIPEMFSNPDISPLFLALSTADAPIPVVYVRREDIQESGARREEEGH